MLNWKNQYGYIEDFYNTVYELYTEAYVSYPITYYSLDMERSVYDREIILSGSYEKNGVGALSGFRWKKILLLPIYSMESIQPSHNADEAGLRLIDNMLTTIAFPSSYGLYPYEGDMVVFHQNFMFNDDNIPAVNFPVFVVINIDKSTYGTKIHYKCSLKQNPTDIAAVEKQVISKHIFVESTRKIYDINRGYLLLNIEKKMKQINDNINNNIFDNHTGVFLNSKF